MSRAMGVMPHPAQPSQPDMMATSYQSGGMDSLDGEGMVMGGDLTPTGMSPVLVHYMGGGGRALARADAAGGHAAVPHRHVRHGGRAKQAQDTAGTLSERNPKPRFAALGCGL